MAEALQVSFEDRYVMVRNSEEAVRHVSIPFVATHMGEQAIRVLKRMWDEGIQTAPRNATPRQLYETAYGNWLWTLRMAYDLIRERLGEDGVRQFQDAQLRALRTEPGVPGSYKLLRTFARGKAFKRAAQEIMREFDWLSPVIVEELTGTRAVFGIPQCKLLEFDGTEDICNITCQGVYPVWLAEKYDVAIDTTRQGTACTHIVTCVD